MNTKLNSCTSYALNMYFGFLVFKVQKKGKLNWWIEYCLPISYTCWHLDAEKTLFTGFKYDLAIRISVCFLLIRAEQMGAWRTANPQLEWFQPFPRGRVRVAFLVDWEGSRRGISLFISIPVGALPAEINFFCYACKTSSGGVSNPQGTGGRSRKMLQS